MTTTARDTPPGDKLPDGFGVKIAFAADPDVNFWEVTVTPPGREGGEPVDQTTMWNEKWMTALPQMLQSLTPAAAEGAYDPEMLDEIDELINVNGWITIHFPDGAKYNFAGYLKTATPTALAKGQQPRISFTIQPTNQIDGVETDPIYVAPPVPET